MDLLTGLLGRYQQLFKDKQQEINLIIEVVKQQTNLILKSEEIKLKDGILFIKTKPKYKLVILLKKQVILEKLTNQKLKVFELK